LFQKKKTKEHPPKKKSAPEIVTRKVGFEMGQHKNTRKRPVSPDFYRSIPYRTMDMPNLIEKGGVTTRPRLESEFSGLQGGTGGLFFLGGGKG